jgi:hypothetical protein
MCVSLRRVYQLLVTHDNDNLVTLPCFLLLHKFIELSTAIHDDYFEDIRQFLEYLPGLTGIASNFGLLSMNPVHLIAPS